MKKLVESSGVEVAFKEVDVVTTGTFGAMCSSGAMLNLGHSDPPIKIQRAWINGVEVCHPGAAVDLYVGATAMSEVRPFEYGGGHVIEDLIAGKEVEVEATAYRTDCYPRTRLRTTITGDDLNQFYLLNFRNCYQRYACATNSRDDTIYTYMGKLLPRFENATFSGSGALNPLMNDPDYETIGIGTRIFLGGGQGHVIGEGTQHDPCNGLGTLMVRGDCRKMSTEFIRGAVFTRYGTTLYVGVGIPIPLLNQRLAQKAAVLDEEIFTDVIDYGIPRRDRPRLERVSYRELKSGAITIGDRRVRVSPLSSLKTATKIADTLKLWIESASFHLSTPTETLPRDTIFKHMKQTEETPRYAEKVIKAPRQAMSVGATLRSVDVDKRECFGCGACISLCPMGAIEFKEDFSVIFNTKCVGIQCSLCVDSCPARAIRFSQPVEQRGLDQK